MTPKLQATTDLVERLPRQNRVAKHVNLIVFILAATALLMSHPHGTARAVPGTAPQGELVVTTSPLYLPGAHIESPYRIQLEAVGGKPPYTWSALVQLPAGLILSKSGVLSGTPKAAGQHRFQIEVRDPSGHVGQKVVRLDITRFIDLTR